IQSRQREKFLRPNRNREFLSVDHSLENRDELGDFHREARQRVAVVVKDVERLRSLLHEPIEVGEHLLGALEAFPGKQKNADLFLPERRVFIQRRSDRRTPMLPVVNEELSVFQVHLQIANVSSVLKGLELYFGVVR